MADLWFFVLVRRDRDEEAAGSAAAQDGGRAGGLSSRIIPRAGSLISVSSLSASARIQFQSSVVIGCWC
jgi:hypothetical protein